jgi:hypothetical protein
MEVMIISALSIVLIFLSFIIGLHYGSKVRKEEKIEIPNPVRLVRNHIEDTKERKLNDLEQQIEEINLFNIDSYDGTELGQKEFPKD